MAKVSIAAVVLCILTGTQSPSAQTAQAKTISVGSVVLRLGMTKAEVFDALIHDYQLNPVNGSYLIMTKVGPPFKSPGLISFDAQDHLNYVSRDFSPDDVTATEPAADSLFAALETVTEALDAGTDVRKEFLAKHPDTTEMRSTSLEVVLVANPKLKQIQFWRSAEPGRTVSVELVRAASVNGGAPTISIHEDLRASEKK
jgi:hypothetical protein